MSPVAVIWSMVAAACLTLAAVHLLVWWEEGKARASLAFSVMAAATAGIAACELWMMRAETPAEFGTALRWLHVPGLVVAIALVVFVRLHLRAGRPWLAWATCAVRSVSLALDFIVPPNLNYREITGVRQIPFLGESVSVGEGVPNPLMLVGQLSLALLVIFVADAALTVWRRGDRRQALVTGGSIVFFALAVVVQAVLVLWHVLDGPITVSLFFMGVVAAMGYEMSREVLRAARLSDELVRKRMELAHLSRVTMLGELSGSIAHELNQPLTAILSNAQAAKRLLARETADLDEVRDIIADIVDQDNRAGEVIHRLRLLLKKGEVQRLPLDVNDLVQDVLALIRSDFADQGVSAHTDFALALPMASGDRVQLQQVLLNLLMNACDAMNGNPPADRQVIVRTESSAGEGVHVSVSDRGAGIAADELEQVFEPFFTTKTDGLGLGLSVCRSILTAHGGKLWAVNNPQRGATFHFTLPVDTGATP